MTPARVAQAPVAADSCLAVSRLGPVNYADAMDLLVAAQAARIADTGPDTILYLEHDPVVTYGRATPREDFSGAPEGVAQVEVARGGLATYHGPGQLIGYLVLNLANRTGGRRPDIHAYMRALEEGLIAYLETEFGLRCCRREGFTGVWTKGLLCETGMPRKLVSIGVSARRWVTSHGFALNLAPDMSAFRAIVPCGITDAEISSVELEYQRAGKVPPPMDTMVVASGAHPFIVAALQKQGWLVENLLGIRI